MREGSNCRSFNSADSAPTSPGWRMIDRLLRPLEVVNANRTFWGWTRPECVHLLGRDQAEFRRHAPVWAGDEVRPYLAAHAYLLGGFSEFHLLGSCPSV
jgi:hypothetical protein